MKIELLIIDPQNDFCNSKGALFVPGATEDMERLANLLNRLRDKISDIHVTLDSHRFVDIAHPIFWVDSNGEHPDPFTIISADDVESGKWSTTNPAYRKRGLDYVKTLATNNRYLLCIWPPHCLIGTWGHNVFQPVQEALLEWEKGRFAVVDYVTKGSNIWTEHYSGVQADVPDPQDPGTMLNILLIETLERADIIGLAGEALSHCVANTVRDIANTFGEDSIKKMVLLEDCCSNVTGFDNLGSEFVDEMLSRGMKMEKSTDFVK